MNSRETGILAEMDRLLAENGSDFCALGLLDPESRILSWRWASGNVSERYRLIEDRPGRGFHRTVLAVGRAMSLQVAELIGARQVHEYPILLSEKLRSAYAVPLHQGSGVEGLLLIGDRTRRIYRPEDRSRAAESGTRLSAALWDETADSRSSERDL